MGKWKAMGLWVIGYLGSIGNGYGYCIEIWISMEICIFMDIWVFYEINKLWILV